MQAAEQALGIGLAETLNPEVKPPLPLLQTVPSRNGTKRLLYLSCAKGSLWCARCAALDAHTRPWLSMNQQWRRASASDSPC